MRRIVITFFFGLWTLVAWSPDAHAQRRGLLPTDYYKEISVSQTAISPAGDLVAFTVMTIVEGKNERHREIWMQQLRGGRATVCGVILYILIVTSLGTDGHVFSPDKDSVLR